LRDVTANKKFASARIKSDGRDDIGKKFNVWYAHAQMWFDSGLIWNLKIVYRSIFRQICFATTVRNNCVCAYCVTAERHRPNQQTEPRNQKNTKNWIIYLLFPFCCLRFFFVKIATCVGFFLQRRGRRVARRKT
jgi:hypothetical protein